MGERVTCLNCSVRYIYNYKLLVERGLHCVADRDGYGVRVSQPVVVCYSKCECVGLSRGDCRGCKGGSVRVWVGD